MCSWREAQEVVERDKYMIFTANITTVSKFHMVVLRLVRIKDHDDMLSNAMVWREVDVMASKGECPTAFGVRPHCCHNPPATKRGRFYLNLCDRGLDSLVDACSCLTAESNDEASYQYEGGNCYDDK